MNWKMAEAERRIEEALRTGQEWLDLGDLALDELPARIGELRGLRGLALGGKALTEEGELEWRGRSENPRLADLTLLAKFARLEVLNLYGCSQVTDLSPLSSVPGLQSLDVSSTGVTDLSPLSSVTGLQNLNLNYTSVTDLSPLASVIGLQSLDVSSTGVTDLSPLALLIGLQGLDFSFTGVTDLSPLVSLTGLKVLNFFGVVAAPEPLLRTVANLPNLQWLFCDHGENVPLEVMSNDYGNCLERLRAHFADVDEVAEVENEVKIILLGNGSVGKTQLCRRFRNLEPDESIESTHGVQLRREPLRLRISGEEETFQVNWWDFGGQDIYHGTHALFLRSRAVFLILWTPALENRGELEENGIPLRNQQLTYWLDYVRSLAGSGSPVIVVQSQCDTFGQERPLPVQPKGFEFFRSTAYSAWTDLGRETLEGQIRDAIRYLREKTGALSIGVGRAEVRRKLYRMREEHKECAPEERKYRTLTIEEFRSLCEQVGGISSPESALDYLHQTGVVFYRSDLFSERIVLDQTWALDAIYAVFDRRRAAPYLRGSGRFTRKDLNTLVWSEHSEDEQRLFLGLMESCGICFKHGKDYEGETEYVAPDLLPSFVAVQRRLYVWRDDELISTLRLSYRFFHQAIIRGLMSRVGQIAGEAAEYWKYGFWLYDRKRDSQVLVQQIDTYIAEKPGAGALEFQAQGRDAIGLLREVCRLVSRNRIGEEPEQSWRSGARPFYGASRPTLWAVKFERRTGKSYLRRRSSRSLKDAGNRWRTASGRRAGRAPSISPRRPLPRPTGGRRSSSPTHGATTARKASAARRWWIACKRIWRNRVIPSNATAMPSGQATSSLSS
ncbi:MAG TPA: COR domain-containing protein [Thermoanaerobaculia bacterium]|jgi:internalin A|nr:COR domain-containing protein [Thermoanaerobaculia bacterium]